MNKLIHCCVCGDDVDARLTDGKEIYPHRKDLYNLPFWKCDKCGNYVGCHHKTENKTQPLGVIPSPEIKKARQELHRLIDPIWQSADQQNAKRKEVYKFISDKIGRKYHTANIRSVKEAQQVIEIVKGEYLK